MTREHGSEARPKVIYVAGYGRSGSTVLSAVLGSHPSVVSVGELGFLPEEMSDPARVCSCGAPYSQCALWNGLDPNNSGMTSRTWRKVERFGAFHSVLWRSRYGKIQDTYGRYQSKILDQVRERSGKSIVLDSSKTAWRTAARPLNLERLAGQDVRIIHLVRDGRSALRSVLRRGENWAIEGFRPRRRWRAFRTALGWTVANLVAAGIGRILGGSRYLRVRYEDLISSPEEVLQTIGRFADLDVTDLVRRVSSGEGFDAGHMVGGNRVRFQDMITLEVGGHGSPKEELPLVPRFLFGILGTWLNRSYGYIR